MSDCILGISSFGHDTSACLLEIKTGKVIFASAQERYSNIKYDDTIPLFTIFECIKIAEKYNYKIIKASISCDFNLFLGDFFFTQVKKIIFDDDLANQYFNFLKNEAIKFGYYSLYLNKNYELDNFFNIKLKNLSSNQIENLKKLNTWYFNWAVKHKNIFKIIQKFLGKIPLIQVSHHLSHAASTFFTSGFNKSNILVIDGQGEQDTITIFRGEDRKLELLSKTSWPNSIGIFYLISTAHLGYKLGDEYKVMGMSAYGRNKFEKYLKPSFKINNFGQLEILETKYVGFKNIENTAHQNFFYKNEFCKILPKNNSKEFTQEHFDFAKSIQSITETVGVELSDWAYNQTKINNICISGGVGLNGLMNNKILNQKYFNDAFVFPAAGDDGTSVGSALYLLSQDKKINFNNKKIKICFYGKKNNLDNFLKNSSHILKKLDYKKDTNVEKFIAKKLNENKVVAIFKSGSEFGPRSLGARSILANSQNPDMREILNKKIKLREPFRPFAPICLSSHVKDYFNIKNESNFMLFICEAKKDKIHLMPSVVHEDGTARVQAVTSDNKFLYSILAEYNSIAKIPILINTSFNIGGEAIVNTIEDAIESFKKMDIDYLVVDNYIRDGKILDELRSDKFSLVLVD